MPPEPALVREAVDTEPGASRPAVSVTPTPLLRAPYPPAPTATRLPKPVSGATVMPKPNVGAGGGRKMRSIPKSVYLVGSGSSFVRCCRSFEGPPAPPTAPAGQTLGPNGSARFTINGDGSAGPPNMPVNGAEYEGVTATPPRKTDAKTAKIGYAGLMFPAALPGFDNRM